MCKIFMLSKYLYNIILEDEKFMNKGQKFIKNNQISISNLIIHNKQPFNQPISFTSCSSISKSLTN